MNPLPNPPERGLFPRLRATETRSGDGEQTIGQNQSGVRGNQLSGPSRLTTDAQPEGRRVDVLGVGVSTLPHSDALRRVATWIEEGQQNYVCFTSAAGIMEANRDPGYARVQNGSGLSLPDGMPLVWAGRYAGARQMERIRGPDFMLSLCALAEERDWRCFFYGAAPSTLERLIERLTGWFPDLQVAGAYSPPFRQLTEAEENDIIETINSSRPDIVWVGISMPKQERWMARQMGRISAPVMLGVGAAFDVHAGKVRQAPRWFRNTGLEWTFWILVQPRRRLRQFIRSHPAFVFKVLRRRPFLRAPDGARGSDIPHGS